MYSLMIYIPFESAINLERTFYIEFEKRTKPFQTIKAALKAAFILLAEREGTEPNRLTQSQRGFRSL